MNLGLGSVTIKSYELEAVFLSSLGFTFITEKVGDSFIHYAINSYSIYTVPVSNYQISPDYISMVSIKSRP